MRLYGIVPAVIGLLQCEGRVSYRALQVEFELDAATLEALKVELITVKQLAVDQDGEMLVWRGRPLLLPIGPLSPPVTTDVTVTALPVASTVPTASTLPVSPPDGSETTSELMRSTPDAERRQVTVLFCDLVDSTRLARQLDPEDYRAVVQAYQAATVAAIEPWDGYVAQYLGDGLLLYFGWPQTHEDAVVRAVYASLALVDAMRPLNARLAPQYGVRVAVRCGLHTGMAVIGTMGSGARQEQLAMGDTPNIAARLQGLAAPDTVALSATTARLVQGTFALEERGTHYLKGVVEPMAVFDVLGPLEAPGDETAAGPRRGPPSKGQIPGTAGGHEPGAPVAAAGQARHSPGTAHTDLRLVQRGL